MRILVVDDHSLVRDGICSLLEAAGFEVVGQVGDGETAITATSRLKPDVILMDISMPKMSGIEALRAIKAQHADIQVVILTISEEESDLVEAIQAGANGYLLKSLNAEGLVGSLRGLERGELALSRQAATHLIQNLISQTDLDKSQKEILTDREIEILQWVAEGLSNKAIAGELYLSENTVKYHLKKIMLKLDVQNRTEAVTRAMSLGLLPQDGDTD